jgi:hypothetical protein
VIDLSYSFYNLFTLLFEVFTLFVVFLGGWLGYEAAGRSPTEIVGTKHIGGMDVCLF